MVAFLRHGGLEMTFGILNNTFALFGMIAVGQGGLVLTSLDGKGKVSRGVRHMVLEDSFGVFTAKAVVMRAAGTGPDYSGGEESLGKNA